MTMACHGVCVPALVLIVHAIFLLTAWSDKQTIDKHTKSQAQLIMATMAWAAATTSNCMHHSNSNVN